jgi:glycosyltransferase involved in cell wall biosynthesis
MSQPFLQHVQAAPRAALSPTSGSGHFPLPQGARLAAALDRPLRILMPSYRSDPLTGGQGVYMRHITKALADLGHSVHVISGPPYPDLDPRVKLIELPSLDLYSRPKGTLGLPWPKREEFRDWIDVQEWLIHVSGGFGEPYTFGERFARWLQPRLADYDIVHDNQTLCYGLLKIIGMGMPVAATIHHPITMDRRIAIGAAETISLKFLVRRWYAFLGMQKKVARALPLAVTSSDSTRRDVIAEFGMSPDNIRVVHLGVDGEVFRPYPEIARKTNRLMATASADVPLKGLVYLVRAYHELLKTRPGLELTIIGKLREGPTAKLLAELGIAEKVQFLSGLTDVSIAKLYAEATIAVAPSVYEGFGFPPAEAMACGVPVVATDGGALPEVIGDAGVIVPKKNPAALATAIGALLDDPARQNALGAMGRARIHERFLWSRCAANLVSIYEEAISANHPPR